MKKEKREHGLRKGQVIKLKIASMAGGGEGVAKDLNVPVFVARVAPGDLAEVELFDVRKDFARGKALAIIEPSEKRTEPLCKLFKVCGGCQWQHINYEAQLEAKSDILRQALVRIGGVSADILESPIGSDEPFYYRNKAQFPVAHPHDSTRILAGYYKTDSHELVNIKHCPIQPELMDRVLNVSKEECEAQDFTCYDETTGEGLLRHINIRASFAKNKALVTLVLNTFESELPEEAYHVANAIMAQVPEVVGVLANFNIMSGNRILGDHTVLLKGEEHLEEILKSESPTAPDKHRQGVRFRLSATSFFQVNTKQAQRMLDYVYEQAKHLLGDTKDPVIIDAYAGVGAIALWLAPLAKSVIGFEEVREAVEDGVFNASLNAVDNVDLRLATVEEGLSDIAAENMEVDLLVLDPPRKGLSAHAMDAVMEMAPRYIIYVSCNPSTLARDLKLLKGHDKPGAIGYKAMQVKPVDLFPQTYHIESVAVLERLTAEHSEHREHSEAEDK